MPHIAQNASVMECAPYRFAGPPLRIFLHPVAVPGAERAGTVLHYAPVLGDKIGKAGICKNGRPVSVVSCQIADRIESASLYSAHGSRPCGIQSVRQVHQLSQQFLCLVHNLRTGKKGFIAHTPHNNAGMIPISADHLLEGSKAALLKFLLIFLVYRIGAGRPVPLLLWTSGSPEAVFRPEKNPLSVAFSGKICMMRVMGASNKVHAAAFHQSNVPLDSRMRHRI